MKRAFTLIELSIVLIIIGLLVGGVLAGQELIKSAKMQAQVSQLREYDTAVNTFKLKYDCLAGDCDNGVALGVQTLHGDGNDDGKLDGCDVNDSLEIGGIWEALGSAGLINYQPSSDLGSSPFTEVDAGALMVAGYNHVLATNFWGPGAGIDGGQVFSDGFSGSSFFTSENVAQLDRLIDDGEPYTGRVLLASAAATWCSSASDLSGDADTYFLGTGNNATAACVSNDGTFGAAGATYSFDATTTGCHIIVEW